ncbi:MAG TPA: FAD-dependent oxidoreductase [Polyangiaceae bacterium]|nr:FAD-dependent oxidoreductase [Polyangiaceae bacterium]
MRVLVLGAGLAGLAATEELLDRGASVTVVEAFPLPGGRTASFDVPVPVAGLLPGDVVEHGLHAWFQHYHALYGLMERAGVRKPPFAGEGIHFFDANAGHYEVLGGPLFWLLNSLALPESLRGPKGALLSAFGRLVGSLGSRLARAEETDRDSALFLLRSVGVPEPAIEHVFRPCLFSLTSLRLEALSALEFLRWMSGIIPDPRIRCFLAGATPAMDAPIAAHLAARGADFRFGVEATRLSLRRDGSVAVEMRRAPDRTGVRHVLVQGFVPAEPPDPGEFDAVVSTLPWERLLELSHGDPGLSELPAFRAMRGLDNVHPLTVRLWFERPIPSAAERYVLASGTVFDVLRPTPEPGRGNDGVRLVDALAEDVTALGIPYRGERFVPEGPERDAIVERFVSDLERMYPGEIRSNRVLRAFVHTREGIVACRPGAWSHRAPQWIDLPRFVLAGDWTRHPYGVCMEGAVRSGALAAEALDRGRAVEASPWAFAQVLYSTRSVFQRTRG